LVAITFKTRKSICTNSVKYKLVKLDSLSHIYLFSYSVSAKINHTNQSQLFKDASNQECFGFLGHLVVNKCTASFIFSCGWIRGPESNFIHSFIHLYSFNVAVDITQLLVLLQQLVTVVSDDDVDHALSRFI